jgi:hypothetical protein
VAAGVDEDEAKVEEFDWNFGVFESDEGANGGVP